MDYGRLLMRFASIILAFPCLLAACASSPPAAAPVASKLGSAPVAAETRPAPIATKPSAQLDWKRLEAAVAEAARDKRMKPAPEKLHSMAIAYARDINRIPVEDMKQFHIDRASLVLERDVFSGETLAEGAALRATVSGGGGGGSTRGARNTSRNTGSNSSRSNSSSSNSNGNNNSSNRSNNSNGF